MGKGDGGAQSTPSLPDESTLKVAINKGDKSAIEEPAKAKPAPRKSQRADHIEGLRVVATVWVVVVHFCKLPIGAEPIGTPAMTEPRTLLITRGQTFPVKIFAVLSGFVTHWAFGKIAFSKQGENWPDRIGKVFVFWGKRLDRVLVTYYITMIVTILLILTPFDGWWTPVYADQLPPGIMEQEVLYTTFLIRQWIKPMVAMINPPCWFVMCIVYSWFFYPFVAEAVTFLEGPHWARGYGVAGALLSLVLLQFVMYWVTWVDLCIFVREGGDFSTGWLATSWNHGPMMMFLEFMIGAFAAAGAKRKNKMFQDTVLGGESKPLLSDSSSDVGEEFMVRMVRKLYAKRYGLMADLSIIVLCLLVTFTPNPIKFKDSCPASVHFEGHGSAGDQSSFLKDPIAMLIAPVVNLLTAIFLFATMVNTSTDPAKEPDRGACAWYLAQLAGQAPYCLAVYLWQHPAAVYFYWGRNDPSLHDVTDVLFFFTLFVFCAMYTTMVEKPLVDLLRYAGSSAVKLVKGSKE